LISVADPKILILEQDPDPTCQVIMDPDHTSQDITDLDLSFQDISDPDPIRIFFMKLSKDFRFKVEMFKIRLSFLITLYLDPGNHLITYPGPRSPMITNLTGSRPRTLHGIPEILPCLLIVSLVVPVPK